MTISLTGGFGLGVGERVVDGAALGPLGALALAVLVVERHRPVPRDELADILWGDDLPATWQPSLRSVVSRVRRRLEAVGFGNEAMISAHGCYRLRLPADAAVDVEEVGADLAGAIEALACGDWARAGQLARAASDVAARRFLPGVKGLWVEHRQAELDELGLQALEIVSHAASAVGDHATAIRPAEAAVTAQPLRESAHVRVIAAQSCAGNRAEALRAWERCRTVLAEELGVSPSPTTEAAYLALLGGDSLADAPPLTNLRAQLSSFVGRAEQLVQVEELLGRTRLLTLVGPGASERRAWRLKSAPRRSSATATVSGSWSLPRSPTTRWLRPTC